MRLVATTPAGLVVEATDIEHVRAEDETGAFGILPGHDDFVTILAISVVTWRDRDGREHHIAVRGGVFAVTGGETVEIATPKAETGDDLEDLERAVVARYRAEAAASVAAYRAAGQLETALVRQVLRYLRPDARIPTFREGGEP